MPARLTGTVNLIPQAGQKKMRVSFAMLWGTLGKSNPKRQYFRVLNKVAVLARLEASAQQSCAESRLKRRVEAMRRELPE